MKCSSILRYPGKATVSEHNWGSLNLVLRAPGQNKNKGSVQDTLGFRCSVYDTRNQSLFFFFFFNCVLFCFLLKHLQLHVCDCMFIKNVILKI